MQNLTICWYSRLSAGFFFLKFILLLSITCLSCMHMSLFLLLSISLSCCLRVYPSVCMSDYQPDCLFVCPLHPSVYIFTCLSMWQFIHLPTHLYIHCLTTCLLVCDYPLYLTACLSTCLFVSHLLACLCIHLIVCLSTCQSFIRRAFL